MIGNAGKYDGYQLPGNQKECGEFKRAFKKRWASAVAKYEKDRARHERRIAAAEKKIARLEAAIVVKNEQLRALRAQRDALRPSWRPAPVGERPGDGERPPVYTRYMAAVIDVCSRL